MLAFPHAGNRADSKDSVLQCLGGSTSSLSLGLDGLLSKQNVFCGRWNKGLLFTHYRILLSVKSRVGGMEWIWWLCYPDWVSGSSMVLILVGCKCPLLSFPLTSTHGVEFLKLSLSLNALLQLRHRPKLVSVSAACSQEEHCWAPTRSDEGAAGGGCWNVCNWALWFSGCRRAFVYSSHFGAEGTLGKAGTEVNL